ncbi:hypothetical protein LEP1GSC058_3265 [Leptospira fainei serovar Hurstbridge str. BUT 6]|uniref:Lipoprotein n=1 Tax=Leptospira fainei serovar Hurstbridge str. BUT 6 TaxID=1193011 RepID=S3VA73_9LEPT|nr:hypothetical protein [Leptospira fainei]EPG73365.1 hypothetical protein LEP1GSC058_3265 [Leptospira fainei serovar Hurstbridge str. BUT 6]
MKKILSMILFVSTILFLGDCSSEAKKSEPAYQPNSDLRTVEASMIKEGDKRLKAEALLGTPTVEENTQDGSLLEWYLESTTYQKNSYKTLAEKPSRINDDTKFIRVVVDKKGVIKKYEYKL